MTPSDLAPWLTIGAAILAAGLWLGRLDQRVASLERTQHYLHGTITVPEAP